MAGILRKFVAGAAASGANSILEKMRQDALAARDAALQKYRLEERELDAAEDQKAFNLQRAAASEDRQAAIAESEAANAKQWEREAPERNASIELKRESVAASKLNRAAQQQELKLKSFDESHQKQLEGVRAAIINAKTPEEADAAMRMYQRLNLKEPGVDTEIVTAYGAADESGAQTKATGILNRRSNQVDWLSPPATSGSPPPGATKADDALARTIKGANGLMFAPSEIEEAANMVREGGATPDDLEAFRAHFGDEITNRYFKAVRLAPRN